MLQPAIKGMYFESSFLKSSMKNSNQQLPFQNIPLGNNKHRPENKDNIDSREGEEQLNKGDDKTHNRKERKNLKKSTKRRKLKL